VNWVRFSDQAPPPEVDLVCWFKYGGIDVMSLNDAGRLVDSDGGWFVCKDDEPTHWCILDAPE
jgi:hypothetical protein